MNTQRIQNILNIIRENLAFLLRKVSLAIVALLAVFSLIIFVVFTINGAKFYVAWLFGMWLGGALALVNLNISYPLAFWLIKKKELNLIDKPNKLFDRYFGAGILIALLLMLIPLSGLLFSIYNWKISSSLFYLLGFSIVAFFVRFGGGIFAKSADISAELMANASKEGINCNDCRNTSSYADKIGDYINNGLALNLDLVESFIAIMVSIVLFLYTFVNGKEISYDDFSHLWLYPVSIIIGSIILCFLTGIILLFIKRRTTLGNTLKPLHGIYLSLFFITIFSFYFSLGYTIPFFKLAPFFFLSSSLSPFICIFLGLVLAVIIGIVTDYYTADSHKAVKETVHFAEYSSTLTELNGMAVGMKSLYIPIIFSAIAILISFKIADYYGIFLLATGFVAMVPIILASALYAPFADNINGVLKMDNVVLTSEYDMEQLSSIGNTLTALAKNFASYAVLCTVFCLFITFVRLSGLHYQSIPLFHPLILSSLFLGSLLPYILSATLIRALSYSILQMLEESQRQLQVIPYLREKKAFPDMQRFIKESGIKIMKDLLFPSLFVFFIPILIGKFFGIELLATMIIGIMLSGMFLSISYTNTGAVLDNSKKMIEKGYCGGKGTNTYENAKLGDLFGDPLKDVLGPSLNNFLKVIIVISIIIIPIII